MSRPIKFRAWDAFQKTYVFEGFRVIGEVTVFGGIDSVIADTREARFAALGYESSIEAWDDFTLEQFTGFVDKGGRDIYDGDIVKASVVINQIDPPKGVFLVRWNAYLGNWALDWRGRDQDGLVTNPHALGLKNPYHDWNTDFAKLNGAKAPKLTVIGNIHQKPDLLKP